MEVDEGSSLHTVEASRLCETQNDPAVTSSREAIAERILHMQLRKIVKENHLAPVEMLLYHPKESNRHMLATSGANMVSIYDNNHCGGHLDLSCFLQNVETEYAKGGAVTSIAWLQQPNTWENEALLAFAGVEGEVSVMSVANCRVVGLFQGHSGRVVDIAAHPTLPGVVLSAGADGTVRMWNGMQEHDYATKEQESRPKCLAVFNIGPGAPTSVACHPHGESFVVGYENGRVAFFDANMIECWTNATIKPESESSASASILPRDVQSRDLILAGKSCIDCLEFVEELRVAALDADGQLYIINSHSGEITQMSLPESSAAAGVSRPLHRRTRFGISNCRNFICCGNDWGEVYVFDLTAAKNIHMIGMPRIRSPVTSCHFIRDCSSIAISTADSIIWRWDSVLPEESTAVPIEETESA